jgi:hypothetical protein
LVNPYFYPNSILTLLGGLVALAVSYYAYRYGRITSSGFLRILSLGFMLLGVGLLAQASAFLTFGLKSTNISDRGAFVYETTFVFLALQAVAFMMILISYARRSQGAPKAAAEPSALGVLQVTGIPASLLLFGTHVFEFGELILVVLLGLIVFQGLLVFDHNRSAGSLMVLGSFSLLLVTHVAKLSASLFGSGVLYLVGDIVQLLGFLLLLLFVIRSGPSGRD